MANEFRHTDVGAVLTEAEYDSVTGHSFDSQATGDILYASSATQPSRLGIGAANTVLIVSSGIPAWSATLTSNTITTPTFSGVGTGTWVARWSGGTAIAAAQYEVTRDADATNQLHLNVPTGATFELSVNDVAIAVLSATRLDIIDGTILELNEPLEWDTGAAFTGGEYQVGRNADGTNVLQFNVPTGATFEFSVNDVVGFTYNGTLLSLASTDAVEFNIRGTPKGSGSDAAGVDVSLEGGSAGTSTTGAAGGLLKLFGGAAGGTGNNNGGRIRIEPGAATGTGLKPLVELKADGGIPTTAVLSASNIGFRYVAGGAVTVFVNDGGVIKSVSIGTPV